MKAHDSKSCGRFSRLGSSNLPLSAIAIVTRRKMDEDSVFTKIIRGEIPCHKIYEDDKTFAFLDIHPASPGHTLIVPKVQVDKIYDLPDEYYFAMFATAKKLAKNMEQILNKRTFYKVVGNDVPHAHIHLISDGYNPIDRDLKIAPDKELADIADKLRME